MPNKTPLEGIAMNIVYDYSGLKKVKDFTGYQWLARSENGAFNVVSYIAMVKGKKIYGYYDYQAGIYWEERA